MRQVMQVAAVSIGVLMGCSGDSSPPLSPTPRLVSVSPADGAGSVPLDASVVLTFSAPVIRDRVQSEVHLISAWAISDSACPDSGTMSHHDMDHCMDDPRLMDHLDQHHATAGGFSWNPSGTQCTFRPAVSMTPGTEYMIHVGSHVMGTEHRSMDRMGSGMERRDRAFHFTTMMGH